MNESPKTCIKRAPIVRVTLVKERTLNYETEIGVVNDPKALASVARAMLGDYDREAFVVLHLNSKHRVVSVEVMAIGTINATLVHPREVFKGAILANATAIAVAHNHPSGDCTPSPEDLALTRTLIEAGQLLGVKLLDHVIIGDKHLSLREAHIGLGWEGA